MYVCVCNALNEKSVAEAAEAGARSPAEVFLRSGKRPQCGKCLADIVEIIETARYGDRVRIADRR